MNDNNYRKRPNYLKEFIGVTPSLATQLKELEIEEDFVPVTAVDDEDFTGNDAGIFYYH